MRTGGRTSASDPLITASNSTRNPLPGRMRPLPARLTGPDMHDFICGSGQANRMQAEQFSFTGVVNR
jgi:hypothetical protein